MTVNKRQVQKEQTRKLLIEAAIQRLAKDGLLTARTSDIADDAGVSHGTVFSHFPTREDLLMIVIEEFGNRINQRIHELAVGEGSLEEILQAHINGLIEYESFYTRLVIEGPLLPSAAQTILLGIQSAISFHIHQAADREIFTGKIRNLPIHMLFNGWIALVHYYLANQKLFAPEGTVLKRYGSELLKYYLDLTAS